MIHLWPAGGLGDNVVSNICRKLGFRNILDEVRPVEFRGGSVCRRVLLIVGWVNKNRHFLCRPGLGFWPVSSCLSSFANRRQLDRVHLKGSRMPPKKMGCQNSIYRPWKVPRSIYKSGIIFLVIKSRRILRNNIRKKHSTWRSARGASFLRVFSVVRTTINTETFSPRGKVYFKGKNIATMTPPAAAERCGAKKTLRRTAISHEMLRQRNGATAN